MIVRELVEILEQMDQDAIAVFPDSQYDSLKLEPVSKDQIIELYVTVDGENKSYICFDAKSYLAI